MCFIWQPSSCSLWAVRLLGAGEGLRVWLGPGVGVRTQSGTSLNRTALILISSVGLPPVWGPRGQISYLAWGEGNGPQGPVRFLPLGPPATFQGPQCNIGAGGVLPQMAWQRGGNSQQPWDCTHLASLQRGSPQACAQPSKDPPLPGVPEARSPSLEEGASEK